MGEGNKTNNVNKVLIIIIIVLVIIILLLLLKKNDKSGEEIIHEGKTVIFDIKCDVDCNCECEICNNGDSSNNNQDLNEKSQERPNDKTKEVNGEIKDNTSINIEVLDKEKIWNDRENLNIFENSKYIVKGKIAPEASGSYEFVVRNSTSDKLKYDISFIETNNYGINIKYKLKKNNSYINSDWVSYSQLVQNQIKLNPNSNNTYVLEWKWFSSSNDNSVGENIDSKYGLEINVVAVQAND